MQSPLRTPAQIIVIGASAGGVDALRTVIGGLPRRLRACHLRCLAFGPEFAGPIGVDPSARRPKENRFRPAVDPLFRSAAQTFGPGVIGVILSGGLDDGSAGLLTVKQQGGTAIVQDPATALYPSMPQSALSRVHVDHCVPAEDIAALLIRLAAGVVSENGS